jgi:putative transposase
MARKRHSLESIAKVLRQAESGIPIAELARKAGVHDNTVHFWKKKYGAWYLGDPRNERASRREHAAQAARRGSDPRQSDAPGRTFRTAVKPAKLRAVAAELRKDHGVSERPICESLRLCRASMRYKPRRMKQNSSGGIESPVGAVVGGLALGVVLNLLGT